MSFDEYKMFEPSSNHRFVVVNNLNGIIERPDELIRYIDQALEAGRLVFGEAWMDDVIKHQTRAPDVWVGEIP